MPIHVICPGCHARFKVSEKFAGKEGPCPKCKKKIRIPAADEQVVIHAPEHSEEGAKDSTGQHVLKPIRREKTQVQPLIVAGAVGGCLVVVILAFFLRGSVEIRGLVLAAGAVLLAPPLALGGYSFLRDSELEPYTGSSLAIRTAVCSLVYAGLWGLYALLYPRLFGDAAVEVWQLLWIAPPIFFVGAGCAYVCYDLDLGSGFFHYGLYLLVTILLRLILGLPAI